MCEPPDLWTSRMDSRYRERAPRIRRNPNGLTGSFFTCEDLPPFRVSGAFAAGKTFDKAFMEAGMDDALPGGFDPSARIKDMDEDGIVAEVLYTTCGFVLGSNFFNRLGPSRKRTDSVSRDWIIRRNDLGQTPRRQAL